MREDLGNERGIDDGGDDLQATPAARAVFDIDIEHALEQARPTHARRRALGVRVIECVLGCLLRWTRNDRRPQRSVGCEHAMEANQMQPRTRPQCRLALHELQRRHHNMGGAVAVGAFELQHDLACSIAFEPFVGNGRAGDIAAQTFELLALMGATTHCGV